MKVHVLSALSDNYLYVVADGKRAVAIDPAAEDPVLRLLEREGLELTHVLITHHHFDHTAGCRKLVEQTGCRLAGPGGAARVGLDMCLADGDTLQAGPMAIQAMATPGHTTDHLAYYVPTCSAVFTGDVLFISGCGRIIGSSAETMWASLLRLRELPDNTAVYCGHDYTVENLQFALHLEPDNTEIEERLEAMQSRSRDGQPTVPSDMATERRTNPFLRADTESMRAVTGLPEGDGASVFAELRRRKDRW